MSDGIDAIPGHYDGRPAVTFVPTLDDDQPNRVKEGLARRRLIAAGKPCPCGAQPPSLPRQVRRMLDARKRRGLPLPVIQVDTVHEEDCPACDPQVRKVGKFDYVVWVPQ